MVKTPINQDEINQAVWSACDTFRGTVEPAIYKDFILSMLFLKYISDAHLDKYDELKRQYYNKPEMIPRAMETQPYRIPIGSTFWDLYESRHEPGNAARIDQALAAIEEANTAKLKGVFQGIHFNTTQLGDEKQKNGILRHLLEDFGSDVLNLRPSRIESLNVVSHTFQYLIEQFSVDINTSQDAFYTPPEISELLSIILDPQQGESICDPACGSGSLLIQCGKQIQKNFAGSKQYVLFGQEASHSTWSLAKINLLLHEEDNNHIECGDTLYHPKLLDNHDHLLHFDVVTANPPLVLDSWNHKEASSDHFNRFHRGVPPKSKGSYAFISHMIETLKPASPTTQGGRMGVIMPHGVLFRASTEGKIRKSLIKENLLDAVIGLPEKIFFGSRMSAVILIFKKQKADTHVLFIDASREFKAGNGLHQLENIEKIVDAYKTRKTINKFTYLATQEEISNNDYNLNIPRYVDTFEEEPEANLIGVRNERLILQVELTKIETEMTSYLKELGYGA